jgi:hypothetical protein
LALPSSRSRTNRVPAATPIFADSAEPRKTLILQPG